ncbi:MAG: hypothetical protein U0903_10835 [Planctomycetales bacterium]
MKRIVAQTPRNKRRGESLFEVVVVMSVMVGLASMSWPTLRASLSKNELQSAARQVASDMSKARLKAMESGVPYEFRYQPDQRKYEITALHAPEATVAKDEGAQAPAEATTAEEPEKICRELSEGLKFVAAQLAKEEEAAKPVELASADTEWSRPIVFYPNGRSSTGRLELEGARDFRVEIKLNSLTGAPSRGRSIGTAKRPEWNLKPGLNLTRRNNNAPTQARRILPDGGPARHQYPGREHGRPGGACQPGTAQFLSRVSPGTGPGPVPVPDE